MKRLLYTLFAASLLLISCEKEEPQLALSIGMVEAPSDGFQQTFTVTSNRAWTASASDPWLSVSPTSGAKGETSVTVKVAANTGSSVRTGSVTFTCDEITRSVTVKQIQPFQQSLVFVHSNDIFYAPDMRGNGLSAEVDWGDGTVAAWRANAEHGYASSGTHTVTIKIAGATWFQTNDVTGISEIDLSGF